MLLLIARGGSGPLLILVLSAFCAVAQTQPRDVTSNDSQTGSISGRVVNESDQPLSDVVVLVQTTGAPSTSTATTTDRNGRFKVSGLRAVPYTVSASLPAHIRASDDGERARKQYQVGDSIKFVLIRGGVITGKVTTTNGEPVAGINVRARLIRDDKGRNVESRVMVHGGSTDDRGVYRIYGLPTGSYIVAAGGAHDYGYTSNGGFAMFIPTYAPSSARGTADEISVRTGAEVTNVDIRFKNEVGRTISGVARGSRASGGFGFNIALTSLTPGSSQANLVTQQHSASEGFAFLGIAEGDYFLTAILESSEIEISEAKLIRVRAADVEGIELSTNPLGLVAGRVVLEESKTTKCEEKGRPIFTEMSISAWHRETEESKKLPQDIWDYGRPATPDTQGYLALTNLAPGQYYFAARLSAKNWYLQSITFTSATAPEPTKQVDATRSWTTVKTGDRLSGLTVTLAEGAGSLNGRLVLGEGETAPEKLFVYLVPVEKENADDVLRFYASAVSPEGKLTVNSVAPGRYWLLTAPAISETVAPSISVRSPDEVETRARLRREGKAAKNEIEFKPCQNIADYQLKLVKE